jgi:hypothetical protein
VTALRISFLALLAVLTIFAAQGRSQTKNSGVEAELRTTDPLCLRMTVRSLATAPATIYKSELPWELRHSIILTAVTTAGDSLSQNVVAGDPSLQKITLNPGQSVSGDIDLKAVFKDLDGVRRKSDVLLFWAYRSPDGLNLPKWSGGWILIPRMQ